MAKARQIFCLALILLFALQVGCHRSFYRRQADRAVYKLVAEKANNPRWPLVGYTINLAPQSRMYSPFSWDHPPMPQDDPYSHKLMHYIDHKKGYPFWHINGDTPYSENPMWTSFLPVNEEGVLVLSADDAVRTALLHSTDYQSQLETLYLSALDVTFERFQFDSQFNAGYALDFLHDGRNRNGDGESRSVYTMTTFPQARGIAMRRMGVTGTTLVVGLANRLVWQFSGPDDYSARTLLDFSLVQPLLRQAGRDRVLERLTIAERALLANVRQMERYRRGFYLSVTTGQNTGDGPSRRGGFFGGSGLTGFSGVGGGGFGRIGNASGISGGGGAGGANINGYLGLLQDQQTIRNQETTVSQLRSALAQFEAFYNAERIDFLQVQQVRTNLYRQQSVLLGLKTSYQTMLDNFKMQLGLPPRLKVEISDPIIDRFNLIDNALDEPQSQLATLQQQAGQAVVAILNEIPEEAAGIPWTDDLAKRMKRLKRTVAETSKLCKLVVSTNIPRARNDIDELKGNLDRRVETLNRLREKVEEAAEAGNAPDVAPAVLDSSRIKELPAELTGLLEVLEKQIASLEDSLEASEKSIDGLLENGKTMEAARLLATLQEGIFGKIPDQLAEFSALLLELTLIQAQARAEAVDLTTVEMESPIAFKIAENYRRDWMNARAALVDSWRLVEFNADNLESGLDIVFDGDVTNVGDNPFDLRASAGRLRAGLQFDSPVNRLSERNTYRQSLIEYSQARRQYYRTVDSIDANLRAVLRNIDLNQLNFEVRRQAVLNSIDQVLLARFRLQEPPQPNQQPGASQQLGATTARDLVTALGDLRDAQNDFMSIWVTYETLRRSLDFGLGTMQLDPEGLWIDPGAIDEESGPPGEAAIYPGTFCTPDMLFVPDGEAIPLERPEVEELEPPLPLEVNPPELPPPGPPASDEDDSSDVTASAETPLKEPPLPLPPEPR